PRCDGRVQRPAHARREGRRGLCGRVGGVTGVCSGLLFQSASDSPAEIPLDRTPLWGAASKEPVRARL
ncbi:hypothetical protein, partial [Anaeromassilibacillus sp. Marseille-P3371]|uniref:hypothetical protein n=1 Tax=Anaeromassilibacillus sp. Marseille-P3371 TaxID=1944639 RepID=UPI001A9A44BE